MAKRISSSQWERIEREYLAGEDSISEIADRHEVSRAAIQKRAKAQKWQREVAPRKKVPLQRQPPAPPPTDPDKRLDAAQIADGGRGLVARMLDELDVVTSRRGELEDMIEAATESDEDDDRRLAMERAISLPTRASTMKTLALALKTLAEAAGPMGVKAQKNAQAKEVASRFRPIGPPTLKAVS